MQQHIYKASQQKIISQTILMWIPIALQVVANCWIIPISIRSGHYSAILLINAVLSGLTIPSLCIFFNYYRNSVNKDFIISYNSLKIVDKKTGMTKEILSADITKIELHQNLYPYQPLMNMLPWSDHEYFCFIDNYGKKIIVTCYIMKIQDFWMDTLTRRVDSDKLEKFESIMPMIKN